MRACRTARRGIFRFKFSYCDAKFYGAGCLKLLRHNVFTKMAAAKNSLFNADLIRRRAGSCFAARNLPRCETIKFTAHLASRRSLLCMQVLRRVCFAGKVLRRAIKFKMRARLNFKCAAKFEAGDRSNFRRRDWVFKIYG